MSEKKSIDDKMLLRAIADMVIQYPSYAREIFDDAHDIINIFPELKIISDFLLQPHENNYQEILEETIKEIPDTETKKYSLWLLVQKVNNSINPYAMKCQIMAYVESICLLKVNYL
ncbi:hypothetical protein BMC32_004574 [Escherichia coli]|nr:hypothetical protein [Escherichia coli]